jgi:tetratricopeptide (TPR) repeat protein/nitrate/TMAO reductase-like tetraheme cytochrome c subunit
MKLTLKTVAAVSLLLLTVNAGYIWAFASPTIFYMGNVLAHLVIGIIFSIAGAAVLLRDREMRRRLPMPLAAVALAAALGFGAYLVYAGNVHELRWALQSHIALSVLGVTLVLVYAWRRVGADGVPARGYAMALQAATVFLVVLPLSATLWVRSHPNPSDRIVNPLVPPLTPAHEGGGPNSPFFPSSAKTNVGGIIPANFFMDSTLCGECHKDIYEQWNSSVHHFASFNNQFYRKSIEYMQSVAGTQPSKWCAGCHDHAVFFNGRFDRPIAGQIDTPEAQAGLACTSCHSITHVEGTMGNGGFTIEYPPLHELATSKNPYMRRLDRFLTYLNPEPHRRSFMKPFMRQDQSAYCSACHKVHLDVPVNDYRWFRGFNDYDNWQASGFGEGARSFYYPPKGQTCVDCHMTPVKSEDPGRHADGTVHSHRFAAANTAVPFVNGDAQQLAETRKFLTSGFISVDIFSVSPIDEASEGTRMVRRVGDAPQAMSGFAVGEEAESQQQLLIRDVGQVAAPIDKASPSLAPGSTARVDVVVRTRRIGHFFPGGTVDAFDIWLELEGRDATGKVVYWSGQAADDGRGPVESGAHFYKSYQLDANGNPINKRNAWQARSVLYVRLIPPGAADVAHYRVRIPKDAVGAITFTAKLNYRKFAHYYTQFAYAGQPVPGQDPAAIGRAHNDLAYSFDAANIPKNVSGQIKDEIPALPTIVLAQAKAVVPIGNGSTPTTWVPVVEKKDRERWNDWGIGLLLQGDIKAAEYAFKQVTVAEPEYADGWLNVARALIQEGETDAAKPYIAEALKRDPSLGRIYFFRAMIEKADGDYTAALASLKVAAEKYPRDRVVLNQIARILFLERRYAEALTFLERVALVDPEDLQMHYTAMLCYRGLGQADLASREEQLFTRFKAEEASQAITGTRRMISPEDNNERQQIHEHESVPLAPSPASARGTKAAAANN